MKNFRDKEIYRSIRKPVELATTLDPEIYRSEEFFKQQQEAVFSKSWVCVGYTSQWKEAGTSIPVEVAGQPLFLSKTKTGEIKGYYNVCRHRGSKLVLSETRSEKIRCPYHSWTYSHEGQLLACPLFREDHTADSFCKEDYHLLSVRVETWGCFVFVNLDANAMPLKDYLADCATEYGNFPLQELVLVRRKRYDIKANWQLIAENFLEYYHLPWVHPELCTVTAIDMHKRNQGRGMYMSFYASPLLQGGTPIDANFLPPMPQLNEKEANSGYFPLVFPNVAMFLMPHHLFSLVMQPTSATTTEEYGDLLVHPKTLEEENIEKKIDEMFAFYDMVNIQDIVAVERVQDGIRAKAYEGGRMSYRFEEPLHRFQNMVANYMIGEIRVPAGDEPQTLTQRSSPALGRVPAFEQHPSLS